MESDPAAGIGLLAAFAAGMVSFLSPCVLPLVPGYLAAVTGASMEEMSAEGGWKRLLVPSLVFVATFSIVFVLLGVTASALGSLLAEHRAFLDKLAAGLIIAMGLLFMAAPFVASLSKEWHPSALMERAGRGGPVITGFAFAFAWTPCIGPTLAAILAAAALADSAGQGGVLLAFYAAGLGLPFVATALAFGRMTNAFSFLRRHQLVLIGIGGVILVAMGILMLTGEFFRLNVEAQKLLDKLGLNVASDV